MDVEAKVIRKRDPNFTADEKALLAHLVKKRPIIETKLTDGKSIAKKKHAWTSLTHEFNSNINVHKRDTATLKRAWDNLKAVTRKALASQRGSLSRTGGGPSAPPSPIQQEAMMSMVIGRMVLDSELESEDVPSPKPSEDEKEEDISTCKSPRLSPTDNTHGNSSTRKPIDYIRREAVMRIKLLEFKKKIEMQILKKQLEAENLRRETEGIKQEAAKYLLEKNRLEYEKAKLELEKLQNNPY